MSKGMGKVLDSKVAKKVMIPLGKKVISGTKKVLKAPGNLISDALKTESEIAKKKDMQYRKEAPAGAYGKGRSTSDGRMVR